MLKKIIFFLILLFAGCSDWKENPVIHDGEVSIANEDESIGWSLFNLPENTTAFYPYSKVLALAGTENGKIYYSNDKCVTWVEANVNMQNSGKIQYIYNFMNVSSGLSGNYSLAASSQAIFFSTDNGRNWQFQAPYSEITSTAEINCILINRDYNSVFSQFIYVMGNFTNYNTYYSQLITTNRIWNKSNFSSTNGTIAHCIQLAPNFSSYCIAYNSAESGMVKTINNNYIFEKGIKTKNVAIDSKQFLYLGTSKGLYFSSNTGVSWTLLSFSNTDVLGVASNSSGCIYASSKDSICCTITNGMRWTNITPFENLQIKSIYVSSDDFLYVLTAAGKNYMIKTSTEYISMPPVLMSPQNNTVSEQLSVILKWIKYENEKSAYCLQVSTDWEFKPPLVVDKKWISKEYYNLENLSGNTKYYWRLCAINSVARSPWSEVSSFSTK